VLCAGNEDHFQFVLRWIAFMLQHPAELPEVALAFRGAEGTGKGTLGRTLMKIAGVHGLTVASPTQFAGRFNAHLRDCIFLFADEAFWPGRKDAEGLLKQLVTEPVVSFEGKGVDIVPGRDVVHLMLATNDEWVAPAGITARRFAVFDVADHLRNDRAFFGSLWAQLENGGLGGMVHDLNPADGK
jgi:phage/plasmid-associated DNA primase